MIRYSNEDGFIKSEGIRDENDSRKVIPVLPKIAIGVFSTKLFEYMVKSFKNKKVGYFGGAGVHRPVYIIEYKNNPFVIFNAGISAPWISSDIEDLNFNGVDTFIIFGNCGVLNKNIKDCSIIIPNKAFRDEGTSYHYLPDSESIKVNTEFKDDFVKILNKYSFTYTEGATWTTDAFYRETKDKIEYFKKKGAICVEMEASAISAVCKRKGLHYFTFYYAGDNLDSIKWDRRSLSQEVNMEKKKEIPILAIELANKIYTNRNILQNGKIVI